MPVVEYETQELLNLLDGKYDIESLRELIPLMGVGLESIDETTTHLEVFPNRADMLSIEGFIRSLKGFLEIEVGAKEYDVNESGITLNVEKDVKDVRPYIASAIVLDIELTDESLKSLMNIQEKLHITHGRNRAKVAIGVHDLDKIKPDFTYTVKKPDEVSFIPLDMDTELNMKKILSKHPKGRDYAWIVEKFDKYPVIFDGRGEVLSFPPIINGEYSRLRENTKNIFIECTGTSQIAVNQAVNIIITSVSDRKGMIQSVKINYQ